MLEDKVELEVMGITRKAFEYNAYALLLKEKDGERILPLVVGVNEAQAIAVRLEEVILPRPLTHDLFVSMFHAFGIMPEYVDIYDFVDGVFYSHLHLSSQETEVDIDSRTSDAVAIALRTGTPIFTSPELLSTAGYIPDESGEPIRSDEMPSLDALPVERLKALLKQAVDDEEYERAAEIQKIIASKME